MKKHLELNLTITAQANIHRSQAAGYARDMICILERMSETAKVKLFTLTMAGDKAGVGEFWDQEMNHYRANRGN